jgi:predicted Zn-ribbon and HTH transcriptional regulator
MKKNALTMDQLEKVSGGILNVGSDDYLGECTTIVSWKCKDCECIWERHLYQPPDDCPDCMSKNIVLLAIFTTD